MERFEKTRIAMQSLAEDATSTKKGSQGQDQADGEKHNAESLGKVS